MVEHITMLLRKLICFSLLMQNIISFQYRTLHSSVAPHGALKRSFSTNPHQNTDDLKMSLIATTSTITPRIQKIKEITMQKDILRDVTASEFALKVEMTQNSTYIDYEKLISKLDTHLLYLQKREMQLTLPNTISTSQEKLIERINSIKQELEEALRNSTTPLPSVAIDPQSLDTTTTSPSSSPLKVNNLRILVREDGSVDWDGAIASGKEVAKFGTELWERLNGKEEGVPSLSELFSPAQAKVPTTPEIQRLERVLVETQGEVGRVTGEIEGVRGRLRQDRKEGKILSPEQIFQLRSLDTVLKELEKKSKVLSLNLDMENICSYLMQELETSLDASEQRGLVAEVALIDKQIVSMMSGVQIGFLSGEGEAGGEGGALGGDSFSSLVSLIDEDELNLIINEVQDLKSRLGLLDTKMVPSIDWGSIGKLVVGGLNKVKAGLTFFSEGIQTLLGDVQYAWILLIKAVQGYTLKPREVNTLRRTGRDVLTLIPFTIILIIPLSPIGHVLVFSFIQRFFPEFYPSCFSEKRLNLRKLFSEVSRKDEDILLLGSGEGTSGGEWSERIAQISKGEGMNILSWISNFTKTSGNEVEGKDGEGTNQKEQ